MAKKAKIAKIVKSLIRKNWCDSTKLKNQSWSTFWALFEKFTIEIEFSTSFLKFSSYRLLRKKKIDVKNRKIVNS